MAQVIPSKKTNETWGKQGCQLEDTKVTLLKATDHFLHQWRRQWLLTFCRSNNNLPGCINHLLHYQVLAQLLITTHFMNPVHTVHCRIHWGHWLSLLNERHNVQREDHRISRQKCSIVTTCPWPPVFISEQISRNWSQNITAGKAFVSCRNSGWSKRSA